MKNQFSKSKGDVKGTWKIINKNIKNQVSYKKVIIKENGILLDQKRCPKYVYELFC